MVLEHQGYIGIGCGVWAVDLIIMDKK